MVLFLYRKHPVLLPRALQQMGRIRYQEALKAADLLGNPTNNLIFLGYPDFGSLHIWMNHWNSAPAYQGLLTRTTAVPYPFAYRPGAAYKGENIVADLESLIRDFKPTHLYLPHPDDYNNDHPALFLFTRIALWNLLADLQPELRHYLIHYSNWPKPRGLQTAEWQIPPKRLRHQNGWTSFDLRPSMIPLKQGALLAHRSQWEYSSHYLASFVRPNELFWTGEDTALLPQPPPLPEEPEILSEPPDLLSIEEQSAFVGLVLDPVQRQGAQLKFSLRLSKPLTTTKVTVHLFGYSTHTPFALMPKIHLIVGATREIYTDMNQPLSNPEIITHRSTGKMEITCPLSALGNPDRFLIAAKTSLGDLPLDHTGWRVFTLHPSR